MKYIKSELCQLGWISCMGCCGHSFKNKISVAKGIEKNTYEYIDNKSKNKALQEFMNRSKERHSSGICQNLVYDKEKDKIFCPMHPELNSGKDIRLDHHYCDILHVCKTSFLFDLWDNKRKNDFLKFLRKKSRKDKLDWYTYSSKMTDNTLLEEFEGLKWD
ncbi:hypothetical protein HQ545_07995 [Candidatus Woesearchaeota archaeon]|nr:hypothetical protein [Candidatus Woesearchaeota archaeon]